MSHCPATTTTTTTTNTTRSNKPMVTRIHHTVLYCAIRTHCYANNTKKSSPTSNTHSHTHTQFSYLRTHLDNHVLPKHALQVETRGRQIYSSLPIACVYPSLNPPVPQPEQMTQEQQVYLLEGRRGFVRGVQPDVPCT